MVSSMFGNICPYGKKSRSVGYSQRAKGYYKWITDFEERHSDTMYSLKSTTNRIIKVGSGYVLPYSQMNLSKSIPFKESGGVFYSGIPFIECDDLTPDVLKMIVEFRPQAMFGGEITSYQKEVVPKFIKDLQDFYPDLYEMLSSVVSNTNEICESYSYVGRTAMLSSIKKNINVVYSKKTYHWDGEFLTSMDRSCVIFKPVEVDNNCFAVIYKPVDDETVEISNNDQVDGNTIFVD